MTKKEQICSILKKMGYTPEIDNDGDIEICHQMKNIFFLARDEEETPYLAVLFPQFHKIEEGDEALVLTVCNKMTREFKLAKVFVDQSYESVSASCEFYYANEESLEQNIEHSLRILSMIRSAFRNTRMEMKDLND